MQGSNIFDRGDFAASRRGGTRCGMKNVNSFSAAVRGIEYEAKRQIEILESRRYHCTGNTPAGTMTGHRHCNARSRRTHRPYRREPDLPTINVPEEKIRHRSIPELPNVKLQRYVFDFGLSQTDAT